MPPLARLYIRTALIYLVGALAVGAFMVLGESIPAISRAQHLRPTYYHLLMLGWVTQLIFGVMFWMFPVLGKERPRGNEQGAKVAYYLLNLGLLLRLIFEPMQVLTQSPIAGIGLAVSAVIQVLAGWLFVAVIWERVKGK